MVMEETEIGPVRECAQEVRKAGERAADLTKQLLAFSRKQVLQPEIVDLNTLILDMQKLIGRLLPANIRLVPALDPNPCWILVDPSQMGQIILNLAVNARDAMPEGGTLMLETAITQVDKEMLSDRSYVQPGPYISFIVTDTGIGISQENQAHIFEPFFTTKEIGRGTGLGLATAFGIVKQSGGYIWLYSEVGKGTSFKLFFPQVIGQDPRSEEGSPTRTMTLGGATILVVEDQDSVRKLVVRTLIASRYLVLEASNAKEALEMAASFDGKIDLLFTDMVMPGLNGRDLAKRVQEIQPDVQIIFTSGYTETFVVDQGVLESGITLLQKPFSPNQLRDCIQAKLATS
jgi:two-component system, cell cycle sensor histidine kinase and response regulator CckA